jgi:hypothetical protein
VPARGVDRAAPPDRLIGPLAKKLEEKPFVLVLTDVGHSFVIS